MMNQQESTQREIVSDLMDGHLQGADFAHAVELASGPGEARNAWCSYHLVGEVLRSGPSAALMNDSGFAERVSARLALGKIAIENVAINANDARADNQKGQAIRLDRDSANAPSFRWKLVAGLASFAAVVAVSWNLTASLRGADAGARWAAAPQATQVAKVEQAGPQVMIRDPHLDALMAAHKQFGGTSALQMPAGFLRNATFEGPSR
jgi:sigma-E factor negative regulatory protein RseA